MFIKDALSFTAVAPLKPQLHISFPVQLFPKSVNNLVKQNSVLTIIIQIQILPLIIK